MRSPVAGSVIEFRKRSVDWMPRDAVATLDAWESKSRLILCPRLVTLSAGEGRSKQSRQAIQSLIFGWCVSTFGSWVEFMRTAATSLHVRHGAISSLHSLFASFCVGAFSDWR